MFRFYNSKSNCTDESFNNLIAALKEHDDYFIFDSLKNNPEFATRKTQEKLTIPMLAAEHGCKENVFSFILSKSKDVLNEETPEGETLKSILIQNERHELLRILAEFQNSLLSLRQST